MATTTAQKQSVNRYRAKKDSVVIYLPTGTAAAIRAQGESVSGLCGRLLSEWLTSRGVVIKSDNIDVRSKKEGGKNPLPETPQPENLDRSLSVSDASDRDTKPLQAIDSPLSNDKGQNTLYDDKTARQGNRGSIIPPVEDNGIIDIDTFL